MPHELLSVTNVVVAGLGGQGVIKASDILADVAFRAGLDVKKAEIHGMSQRGGSVATDVRFGNRIFSPMIPAKQGHFLVVLAPDQVENNRWVLRPDGLLITPACLPDSPLNTPSPLPPRSINIALLGVLSTHLAFSQDLWEQSIHANLPASAREANLHAFQAGRRISSAHLASRGGNDLT